MPRGDRSGPMGAGPMTGRGLGDCGEPRRLADRFGRGRGGYGRRNRFFETGLFGWERSTPDMSGLAARAAQLGEELAALKRRIEGSESSE